MLDALSPLLLVCSSARLTECGLIRTGTAKNSPGWAINAFSVLEFSLHSPAPGRTAPLHLTNRPERSPSGDHQLFVSETVLTVDEASALINFEGGYHNPRVDGYGSVDCDGSWVGPSFVSRTDTETRACLPAIRESLWLIECWHKDAKLQKELGLKGTDWLQGRIKELLGISLATRSERIGNFLVVLPELRVSMRTELGAKTDVVGVEIVSHNPTPSKMFLVARGMRAGEVVSAHARVVGPGLHVVPSLRTLDRRDVELYDADSGLLLDHEGGVPFRQVALTMNIVTQQADLRINTLGIDGLPRGEPVLVKAQWGITQNSHVGVLEPWETLLSQRRTQEQREVLRTSGQFFLYRGGPDARKAAVADIQALIHNRTEGYLKILDPYFGARDAVEFLFSVFDRFMPIQVLTALTFNEEEPPAESVTSAPAAGVTPAACEPSQPRPTKGNLRAHRRRTLQKACEFLRKPDPNTDGLMRVEVRVGGGAFHDRFLITRDHCWQLGCSLNQIGGVISTIVEFPYPALIESEFDLAWERAKKL